MRYIALITIIMVATYGCVGMAVRAVAQPSKPDFSKLLENADVNGDGIITKAEFTAARAKMFDRLDRNHDGYLTKDDMPRFSLRQNGSGRIQEMVLLMDKDGDGRVSRDEFVNSPSLLFDRADANHDGQVDSSELAAFKSTLAARGTR
jgi:Ca2+-binding EF-hand superfamily protein